MRTRFLFVALLIPLVGCNTLRKIPGFGKDTPGPGSNPLPDDYTVTGVTTSNFQLVPVAVLDRTVIVRVNRLNNPEKGWHDCDQFEIFLSTKGTGGGYVRFGYLNLTVGGVSWPVAPTGTAYEIRSVALSTDHNLY